MVYHLVAMAIKQASQSHLPAEGESQIDTFKKSEVRKVFHEKEWWFSVKDVLEALVDTPDGNRYSRDLRSRDHGLKGRWAEITRTLPFGTNGGTQEMTFINIEGIFRIIQSVPSKRAEPFKRWLAKVGFERLQEIHDPELAVKRAIALYKAKGYDEEWIEARLRNRASRLLLTSEWEKQGVVNYIGILTDAISTETFDKTTTQLKEYKGLKKTQSLRDNMTPIELTLTTLGEQATHEIIKSTTPNGVQGHVQIARQGGRIAGSARKNIERATSKPVVSSENYLTPRQRKLNAEKNQEFTSIVTKFLNRP